MVSICEPRFILFVHCIFTMWGPGVFVMDKLFISTRLAKKFKFYYMFINCYNVELKYNIYSMQSAPNFLFYFISPASPPSRLNGGPLIIDDLL